MRIGVHPRSLRSLSGNRDGAVGVIAAICLVALLAAGALAVDAGYGLAVQNQLQSTADAAALAAASGLPDHSRARELAKQYAEKNMSKATNGAVVTDGSVVFGAWDAESSSFTAGVVPANAVEVTARRTENNGNAAASFLGTALGYASQDVAARSIAVHSPPLCLMVLNERKDALKIKKKAEVHMEGCAVQANTMEKKGLKVEKSDLYVGAFCLSAAEYEAKGCNGKGKGKGKGHENSCIHGPLRKRCPQLDDPLAGKYGPPAYPASRANPAKPAKPHDCAPKKVDLGAGSTALSGNCRYEEVRIRNGATVTLPANAYVEDLIVDAGGKVTFGNNAFVKTVQVKQAVPATTNPAELSWGNDAYLEDGFDRVEVRAIIAIGARAYAKNIRDIGNGGRITVGNLAIIDEVKEIRGGARVVIGDGCQIDKLEQVDGATVSVGRDCRIGKIGKIDQVAEGTGLSLGGGTTYLGELRVDKKGSSVTLAAGTYFIDKKFEVKNGDLTGDGVSLYLDADAKIKLKEKGTVDLKAPTTGTYAGMVILQAAGDPKNAGKVKHEIKGGNASLGGMIYLPTQTLKLKGAKGGSLKADWTAMIVYKMEMNKLCIDIDPVDEDDDVDSCVDEDTGETEVDQCTADGDCSIYFNAAFSDSAIPLPSNMPHLLGATLVR